MTGSRVRLVALAVTAIVVVGASAASGEYISFWGRQKFFERGDPLSVFGEGWISKKICPKKIKFKLKDSEGQKFRLRSKKATSGYFAKYLGDIPRDGPSFGRAKVKAKQKCGNPPAGIEAGDSLRIIIGDPSAPPPNVTSANAPNVTAGDKVKLTYTSTQTGYSVSYLTATIQVEQLPGMWIDVDVLGSDSPVFKGGTRSIRWSTKSSDPPGHYRFLLEYFHGRSWDRTDTTQPEESATADFYLGTTFGEDLVEPTDGSIDNDGNLVVADTFDDQLEVFSPSGSKIDETDEIFNEPKDVAFDDADRTYIAEFGSQDVAFTEGTAITRIDNDNWSGGRCAPVGIDVVRDGSRIWVADSCSIIAMTRTGQELLEIRDGIDDVDDVALAPDGSIWAADVGAGTLLHYSAAGALLGSFGEPNVTPQTVDVDPDGRLWVGVKAELPTGTSVGVVYLLDAAGSKIATFGQGTMDRATGIAVGGLAGDVYVIDRGEWQIVHLRHPI